MLGQAAASGFETGLDFWRAGTEMRVAGGIGAGSLPPKGPGPARKALILQVSLAWRQLTVRSRETSVLCPGLCLCVARSDNQDRGDRPVRPVALLWAVGGGAEGGRCPHLSSLLSQGPALRGSRS